MELRKSPSSRMWQTTTLGDELTQAIRYPIVRIRHETEKTDANDLDANAHPILTSSVEWKGTRIKYRGHPARDFGGEVERTSMSKWCLPLSTPQKGPDAQQTKFVTGQRLELAARVPDWCAEQASTRPMPNPTAAPGECFDLFANPSAQMTTSLIFSHIYAFRRVPAGPITNLKRKPAGKDLSALFKLIVNAMCPRPSKQNILTTVSARMGL